MVNPVLMDLHGFFGQTDPDGQCLGMLAERDQKMGKQHISNFNFTF